jgi:DNA helicase II / ATP-dependent DNA helicase PcrA
VDFIADLHIHSHYSLATSKQLVIPQLELWGKKKGITVIGTGDAAHPGWLAEIKKDLRSCGNGLFTVKKGVSLQEKKRYDGESVYFILTAEISSIYRYDGRVRKVHNIVLAPSFASFEKIQKKLSTIGNITSDGRPILGLDSRDLLEIVLEADSEAVLIPAHIWTPWFSVLGSKSGFDSIEECYRDLSSNIFAVETGLSSDPPMNRRCSFLDKYTLVSNSDAHSPEKLGREANLFSTDCSYEGIMTALKDPDKGFKGTIEYFPEEGKYHLDGHRSCTIRWEPEDTIKHNGICPVCGKPVTVGVLNRVNELADRKERSKKNCTVPFLSLTGLKSIIAEWLNVREQSKKVSRQYDELLLKFGSEFTILIDVPVEDLVKYDPVLAEGIDNLRKGMVRLEGGYDGVFGSVNVFNKEGA